MEEVDPVYDHHRKKVLVAGLAVTAICTQLAAIMSIETDKETARWNEKETQEFVQFLVDHKAEGGDTGGFKNRTMNAAAEHIAPHRDVGVVKEAKHLQTKWNSVSDLCLFNDRR